MAIYPLDQRRSSSSPLTTPSRGRRSATCALRRSSLPDVRAPPQAAPRTLEASWPCPTAGTPRARPMRRPYGEPIAFTVVMHSPTLKSHCRPSSSIFLARRPTPRSAEGPRAFADDCDELRIGEQSPCAVQAMGKHRLSQASTKSIILEVPNGNARARARGRGKRRALLLCARNRHRWSLGSTTV